MPDAISGLKDQETETFKHMKQLEDSGDGNCLPWAISNPLDMHLLESL